jgi:hypothetical protein
MFHRILNVAIFVVACSSLTARDSRAQEFPAWNFGEMWKMNLELDRQWLNNYFQMTGKFGPLASEYITQTAPVVRTDDWYLQCCLMVPECAVDLPNWYWMQAVPRELRKSAELRWPEPISYLRPVTEVTRPQPQTAPHYFYGDDANSPYGYYDSATGQYIWRPQYRAGYYPGYRSNYDDSPSDGQVNYGYYSW